MPEVTVTGSSRAVPLCRAHGHTCGRCCWGDAVTRPALESRLRRQARLFRRWFGVSPPPGRLSLFLYELTCRGGVDLLLGLALLVPGLGAWLRPRLRRHLVCAFLAFEDDAAARVGCLLHPSRCGGQDVRPAVAFQALPGIGCGEPGYSCLAAHRYAHATWEQRRDFGRRTAGLDWYRYSLAAATYTGREESPE